MNHKRIQIGIVAIALIGTSMAAAGWQGDKMVKQAPAAARLKFQARIKRTGQSSFSNRLSLADKARVAGALLKVQVNGVTDHLSLDVRSPYVTLKGSLDFYNFYSVHPSENKAIASGGSYCLPTLKFKVAKPNKPHLVSFYINSSGPQSFLVAAAPDVWTASTYDLWQTQAVPSGPYTLSCVVTPKNTGNYSVAIENEGMKTYSFTRVEVAVVD
jgi:hypothetical protein